MKNRTMLGICGLAGVICFFPGCESGPGGAVSEELHSSEKPYLGNWRTPAGDLLMVKDTSGASFSIEHAAPGGNKKYEAYAISVGGKDMWEVALYKPTVGSNKSIPVYDFYLVQTGTNSLTVTPFKSDWLEKTVKEMNAGSYKSTGDLMPGTGGAVVKDPAAMEAILKKAAGDPNAFGQPEVLTRVK